jgi:hypothetical protein
MSIVDKDTIDSIGISKNGEKVTLAISDHLNWDNECEHLIIFQDKLNTYLRFLESGEVYETYPQAKGKQLEIMIYAKYELSEKAEEFLDFARRKVAEAGYSLECQII